MGRIPKYAIPSVSPLLGLPPGAAAVIVESYDGMLTVTSYYPVIIRPATISGLVEAYYTATASRFKQHIPIDPSAYRDIRCLIEGVQ